MPCRPNALGRREGRLANARADIENPIAGANLRQLHQAITDRLRALFLRGPPLLPARGDGVPQLALSGLVLNRVKRWCTHSKLLCGERPNNLWSDKDVAISNIAGYDA